jgi:hypothetical protein
MCVCLYCIHLHSVICMSSRLGIMAEDLSEDVVGSSKCACGWVQANLFPHCFPCQIGNWIMTAVAGIVSGLWCGALCLGWCSWCSPVPRIDKSLFALHFYREIKYMMVSEYSQEYRSFHLPYIVVLVRKTAISQARNRDFLLVISKIRTSSVFTGKKGCRCRTFMQENAKQVGWSVSLLTCVLDDPGSNLSWDLTLLAEVFCSFPWFSNRLS